MKCPEIQQQLALGPLNLLDFDEQQRVSEHLQGCPRCQQESDQLAAIYSHLSEDESMTKDSQASIARDAAKDSIWQAVIKDIDSQAKPLESRPPAPMLSIGLACTYCHDSLNRMEACYCASCLAPHHSECFDAHGHCSAPGCDETHIVQPQLRVRERIGSEPQSGSGRWTLILGAALVGTVSLAAFTFQKIYQAGLQEERVQQRLINSIRKSQQRQAQPPEVKKNKVEPAIKASAPKSTQRPVPINEIRLLLSQGRALFKRRQYQRAQQIFSRVIELHDQEYWGYVERGRCLTALKRWDEAEDDLTEGTDINPSLPWAYAYRGHMNLLREQCQAARKDLEIALVRDPHCVVAQYLMGRVSEELLDLETARSCYSRVQELKASDAQRASACSGLARIQALAALENVRANAKDNLRMYMNLAVQSSKEARELCPDSPEALFTSILIDLARSHKEEALKTLKLTQDLLIKDDSKIEDLDYPELAKVFGIRALLFLDQGMVKGKDARDLSKVVAGHEAELSRDWHENNLWYLTVQSQIKEQKARYAAMLKFREALERGDNRHARLYKRARVQHKKALKTLKDKDIAAARRHYNRLVFLNPWNVQAFKGRARLELQIHGQLRFVARDLRAALAIDPYDAELHERLSERETAFLWTQKTRPQTSAQEHFRRALEMLNEATKVARRNLDWAGKLDLDEALDHELLNLAQALTMRAKLRYQYTFKSNIRRSQSLIKDALKDIDEAKLMLPKKYTQFENFEQHLITESLLRDIYTMTGNPDIAESKKRLKELKGIGRRMSEKFNREGQAHQDKRRYSESIQAFETALKYSSESASAHYHCGLSYLKIGNFIPGIEHFALALEYDPRYADQFYNKIYQVSYVVDLKRIIEEMDKLVDENPKSSTMYFLRAFFYLAQTEFKASNSETDTNLIRAQTDFARCLELNPQHVTAKVYRGVVFFKKKQFEFARADIKAALKLRSDLGMPYYLEARIDAHAAQAETDSKTKTALERRAMDSVKRAISFGFRAYDRIDHDKVLKAVFVKHARPIPGR